MLAGRIRNHGLGPDTVTGVPAVAAGGVVLVETPFLKWRL
jgi:hypothetical protein